MKMTSVTQFAAIITAIRLVARCPPRETIGPGANLACYPATIVSIFPGESFSVQISIL